MTGSADSAEIELSTTAPANAPSAPGSAMIRTTRQSTLPNRQWAVPEARQVPISARWTVPEATAGARPALSSRVVDVAP